MYFNNNKMLAYNINKLIVIHFESINTIIMELDSLCIFFVPEYVLCDLHLICDMQLTLHGNHTDIWHLKT